MATDYLERGAMAGVAGGLVYGLFIATVGNAFTAGLETFEHSHGGGGPVVSDSRRPSSHRRRRPRGLLFGVARSGWCRLPRTCNPGSGATNPGAAAAGGSPSPARRGSSCRHATGRRAGAWDRDAPRLVRRPDGTGGAGRSARRARVSADSAPPHRHSLGARRCRSHCSQFRSRSHRQTRSTVTCLPRSSRPTADGRVRPASAVGHHRWCTHVARRERHRGCGRAGYPATAD